MRKFVVLAILVTALGAAVLVLRHKEDVTVREGRRAARLLDFDERDVTGFVLTTNGTDWRFVRDESRWRIVEPVEDDANEFAIDDLLSATETVPVLRTIDDPEALSAYGLDPAVSTLRFEGVDAVVHFGDLPPSRDGLFARVEGRPGVLFLALVEHTEPLLTLEDPEKYRSPEFLGISTTVITWVSASTPAGEVRLERESDGWWIVSPRRLPASNGSIDEFVRALQGAEIREYHDEVDPADPALGLGAGAAVLQVGSPDITRRFVLGAHTDDDERYATRDDRGTVMTIAAPELDDLALNARTFATRRLSRLNRYRIESFSYRRGDDSLTARRDGEAWSAEDGQALADTSVYELLNLLFETPVTGWSEAGAEAGPPVAVFQYRLESGQQGSIEILPGNKGRVSEAPGIVYALAGEAPGVPRP